MTLKDSWRGGCAGRNFGPSGNSWDWRHLQRDLLHPPCSRSRLHGWIWVLSKDGASTASLGNLSRKTGFSWNISAVCGHCLHPQPSLPPGIPSLFIHGDNTSPTPPGCGKSAAAPLQTLSQNSSMVWAGRDLPKVLQSNLHEQEVLPPENIQK